MCAGGYGRYMSKREGSVHANSLVAREEVAGDWIMASLRFCMWENVTAPAWWLLISTTTGRIARSEEQDYYSIVYDS